MTSGTARIILFLLSRSNEILGWRSLLQTNSIDGTRVLESVVKNLQNEQYNMWLSKSRKIWFTELVSQTQQVQYAIKVVNFKHSCLNKTERTSLTQSLVVYSLEGLAAPFLCSCPVVTTFGPHAFLFFDIMRSGIV